MLRLSLHKNEEVKPIEFFIFFVNVLWIGVTNIFTTPDLFSSQKQVMPLDKQLTYPLYISVNMQVVTPFVTADEEKTCNITVLSDT